VKRAVGKLHVRVNIVSSRSVVAANVLIVSMSNSGVTIMAKLVMSGFDLEEKVDDTIIEAIANYFKKQRTETALPANCEGVFDGEITFDLTTVVRRGADGEKVPTNSIPVKFILSKALRTLGFNKPRMIQFITEAFNEAESLDEDGVAEQMAETEEALGAVADFLKTLPKTKTKGAIKVECQQLSVVRVVPRLQRFQVIDPDAPTSNKAKPRRKGASV
jgi:hypothetical protein